MKNYKLIELQASLKGLKYEGAKFGYAVAKNISILTPEVEALQKAITPSDKFKEYDAKRVEIVKKYSNKDEKGEAKIIILNPLTGEGKYDTFDDESIEKEVAKLREEYTETLEEREKQIKDYNELLETENPITLHKIKQEDLPSNIKTQDITAIFDIIEE